MGSYRSKEDDVARISTSIYVTNFPDSFSAKDLFHLCKQYGHVVDSFIPIKRSKKGKRFGFVRFINIFNKERLVNNLCTVWSGRFKLQANIARFQRTPVNGNMNFTKDEGGFMGKNSYMNKEDNGNSVAKEPTGRGYTYVQVVKGDVKTGGRETELIPVVFLDDECLMSNDFSISLLGRVKEFASLANLKVALCNEGFVNIKIKYMGKLWVLLEFVTRESIKLFRDNISVGSWFSQIIEASRDFITNGRISWVEVEGFRLSCGRITRWVLDFADESDDKDQEDDMSNDGGAMEHIPGGGGMENKSEDPFQIYKLRHKNNKVDRNEGVSDDSLKYPPGFTPYGSNDADSSNVVGDNNATVKVERVNTIYEANEGSGGIRVNEISKVNSAKSGMSGHFKTSLLPRTGGFILGILDEVVKVGQIMRYNMEGCLAQKAKKDWVKELCVKFKVNFLALQETKLESIDLLCVRMCWGNLAFDEKRLLWDYLQSEICKWNGKVVIMGDFNEVRYKSYRYGSKFNAHSAMVFNSFILNSGLVEVSLGGCSFTWCHKTAAKMSKLDRFLMSKIFLNSFPNINAITLE
nr:nucleotide-binding alpha-beta plait domain-containing protein [Tanacetum cinerariifolium]